MTKLDKLYLFLSTASTAEKKDVLTFCFNYYKSPLFLVKENRTCSYSELDFDANCIITGAYEYAKIDRTKEVKETLRQARIREAIEYYGKDVLGMKKSFNKFVETGIVTKDERNQMNRYIHSYATDEEISLYKERIKINCKNKFDYKLKKTFEAYKENGLDSESIKLLCSEYETSVANLRGYVLEYIKRFTSGKSQEEELKLYQEYLDKIASDKIDAINKKIAHAESIMAKASVSECKTLEEFASKNDISINEINVNVELYRKHVYNSIPAVDSYKIYSLFAHKYNLEDAVYEDSISILASQIKDDYDNDGNISIDRYIEYLTYINIPFKDAIIIAKNTLPKDQYIPFKVALNRVENLMYLNSTMAASLVKAEKHVIYKDADHENKEVVVSDEIKQEILDFFDRHNIEFNYTAYSICIRRIYNGTFDPSADLSGKSNFINKNDKVKEKKLNV